MDARQYAPATQRNRKPIFEILSKTLAPNSNILEVASGTGEHSVFFASHCKSWSWIPSDINPQARESITAWKNIDRVNNLALPLTIDASKENWIEEAKDLNIDAIVNINMIHISPWSACLGLIKGANKLLPPGGILYFYGPFKRNGKHTAESNASFDRSLRDRNPNWGIRDLEAVIQTAAKANLQLQEVIEMPANNLSVIFVRAN